MSLQGGLVCSLFSGAFRSTLNFNGACPLRGGGQFCGPFSLVYPILTVHPNNLNCFLLYVQNKFLEPGFLLALSGTNNSTLPQKKVGCWDWS